MSLAVRLLFAAAAVSLIGANAGDSSPDRSSTFAVGGDSTSTVSATAASTLRFAVIGDWGTGSSAEYQVGHRMCKWRRSRPFDLVVTTGDNIYPDGSPVYFQDRFFAPFDCLLDAGVQFRSSLGNHDVMTLDGAPELNTPEFGMKARNYVIRKLGVRLVIADSTSLDRDRLKRALTAESGDRWTVVAFHHPVFSPGDGHGSTEGYRPSLPRMFRRKGVDLVLNGHDHIYASTKDLRGIRYVVTGGGGASLYGCTDRWYVRKCRERHHFLYVVARADELVVKAVARSGAVFDRFSTTGRD
jgi:3',5'-cyclic AMP phosphodiesterase CpdA